MTDRNEFKPAGIKDALSPEDKAAAAARTAQKIMARKFVSVEGEISEKRNECSIRPSQNYWRTA